MSEWYVGIDLGTTNSALSTCRINDSGDIIATSVDLKRKARSGGPNREIEEKTLPSCVKYNKNSIQHDRIQLLNQSKLKWEIRL